MKMRYRVVYDIETAPNNFLSFLRENHAKFDGAKTGRGVVFVEENNLNRAELQHYLEMEDLTFLVEAIYTKDELARAPWLRVRSKFRFEYPQPEDFSEPGHFTYDNSNYCNQCGCGLIQKNPFQISRAPQWGTRHFLMLNWVEDELFADTSAKTILLEQDIKGIKFLDVLNYRNKRELNNIHQICIENILPPGYIIKGLLPHEIEKCNNCDSIKYVGPWRALTFKKEIFDNQQSDIYKSYETYGGGLICARRIIISNRLFQIIVANRLEKDLVFEPITLE